MFLLSRPKITCQCMRQPIRQHQCTCHKSKYIGTRQQSHRSSHVVSRKIFDDVEERARGRCLAKQPPHKWNNYFMRQLHNHYMSCCCYATHNIPFLCAQIKELYRSTRRLTRQLIVEVVCWVDPRLHVNAWNSISDHTNVLALRSGATGVFKPSKSRKFCKNTLPTRRSLARRRLHPCSEAGKEP
jgi:hypothetical protein